MLVSNSKEILLYTIRKDSHLSFTNSKSNLVENFKVSFMPLDFPFLF